MAAPGMPLFFESRCRIVNVVLVPLFAKCNSKRYHDLSRTRRVPGVWQSHVRVRRRVFCRPLTFAGPTRAGVEIRDRYQSALGIESAERIRASPLYSLFLKHYPL